MIESCTRKQMIVAIGCLTLVSILVIVIENTWTPASFDTTALPPDNASLPHNCWLRQPFTELEHCQPCSGLELKSGSPKACATGQYRQKVRCNETGVVYRRCDRAVWLEERHFLVFVAACVAAACGGLGATGHREATLQRRVRDRISQQLANA